MYQENYPDNIGGYNYILCKIAKEYYGNREKNPKYTISNDSGWYIYNSNLYIGTFNPNPTVIRDITPEPSFSYNNETQFVHALSECIDFQNLSVPKIKCRKI